MINRIVAPLAALLLLLVISPALVLSRTLSVSHWRTRPVRIIGRLGRIESVPCWRLVSTRSPFRRLNRTPLLLALVTGKVTLLGPRVVLARAGTLAPHYARYAIAPALISPYDVQRKLNGACEERDTVEQRYIRSAGSRAELALLARYVLSLTTRQRVREAPATVPLMGVNLTNVTLDGAIDLIVRPAESNASRRMFAFVNPDCLNKAWTDETYRALLNKRCHAVFADGSGIALALRWFSGMALRANVNGTDLFPRLCRRAAEHGASIALLGAAPGIAEEVARQARLRNPTLKITYVRDGYFAPTELPEVTAGINASGARVLLVALGAPRQEQWIAQNLPQLHVDAAIGVGGLFDFYSGRIPRAPHWLRDIGGEWCYRLLQEPLRMWRRYIIGNPLFLLRAARSLRPVVARSIHREERESRP